MKPLSIYIHIPFCKKKCLYCDFPSYAGCENEFKEYVDVLIKEINEYSSLCRGYEINTIFLGGGTPTVLPPNLIGKIMDVLFSKYTVANDAEITIEANPGTIDKNTLNELKSMEFNRISLGVQAYQNRLLKVLGRIHSIEIFKKNYYEIREAGFKNINTDLMFSLPTQTLEEWEETLREIIKLQPNHISAYSLIIEEGTPFKMMFEEGRFKPIDEEIDREMYYMAKDILRKNGYNQYEISNFARKGFESKHNIVYWRTEEYIGFGLGSHSYFEGERFHNTYDMKKYIQARGNRKLILCDRELLKIEDCFAEFMFMGLRMTEGIEKKRFYERFGKEINDVYNDEVKRLVGEKLLVETYDRVFLTEKGIDISNYVFQQFLIDKIQ